MSAWMCIFVNKHRPRLSSSGLVLLFLAGIFLNLSFVPDPIKYSVGTACFALVVNLAENLPAWSLRTLSFRPIVIFGLGSYSIYLWQQPFYTYSHNSGLGFRLLLLSGALLCGFASYFFIETPMRRFLNEIPLWNKHIPDGRVITSK
jgi:peptidoglycan/LPS O-acetylase OafA/YrhL